MDQQLMLGILLIIVGAAFALIAVAVVLNRRTEDEVDPGQSESTTELDQPLPDAEAQADVLQEGETAAEDHPPEELKDSETAMESDAIGSEQESDVAMPAATDAAESDGDQVVDASADEAGGAPSELEQVVSVFREPESGSLIVRAGEREFRSARQIRSETQRQAIVAVLEELAAWFTDVDRAAAPERGAEPSGSGMVQAIDAILQRSLESADVGERGVRLISDASGSVKVLIGVKSYELDQVPNKQIQELIREAVAEWEASQ